LACVATTPRAPDPGDAGFASGFVAPFFCDPATATAPAATPVAAARTAPDFEAAADGWPAARGVDVATAFEGAGVVRRTGVALETEGEALAVTAVGRAADPAAAEGVAPATTGFTAPPEVGVAGRDTL
jgi:hypothetical protein